jgi:hypothetical protein
MKKIFSFLLLTSIAFMVGCATLQSQSEQGSSIDNDKQEQYVEDESIK